MRTTTLLASLLLLAVPLAGCLGIGGDGESPDTDDENEPPTAEIQVDKETAWNGDRLTFDGRESTDEDGRIVSWVFDFGDGTNYEAKNESEAETDHIYTEGGVYQATLTVRDDGTENAGSLSDTDGEEITVNHKQRIVPGIVAANPTGGNQTSEYKEPFPVSDGADRVEANVTLRGVFPVGSSEVEVRILDQAGDQLANETITVNTDDEETVVIEADLENTGDHQFVIEGQTGSVQFNGEIRVLYDEDPAGVGFGDAQSNGSSSLIG